MVIVYSKNNCKYCTMVKMFLEANGAEFKYKNIDLSDEAKSEFEKLGAMGVPVTLAGDKQLMGWSNDVRESLIEILGLEL